MILSDDTLLEMALQLQHHRQVVAQHLSDGHTGPAGNDFADERRVDANPHQRAVALQRLQLLVQRRELGTQLVRARHRLRLRRRRFLHRGGVDTGAIYLHGRYRRGRATLPCDLLLELFTYLANALDESFFQLPTRVE